MQESPFMSLGQETKVCVKYQISHFIYVLIFFRIFFIGVFLESVLPEIFPNCILMADGK